MDDIFKLLTANFTLLIRVEVLEDHFGFINSDTVLAKFLESFDEFLFRQQSITVFIEEQKGFTQPSLKLKLENPLKV